MVEINRLNSIFTFAIVVVAFLAIYITVPVYQDQGDSKPSCYDQGFNDGQSNPVNQTMKTNGCYMKAFIAGCMSVDGNTQAMCKSDMV